MCRSPTWIQELFIWANTVLCSWGKLNGCFTVLIQQKIPSVRSCRRRAVMLAFWEKWCDDWLTQAFLAMFFGFFLGAWWTRKMREYTEKKETCGTICLKYLLFIFNFFFWVRKLPLCQTQWDGTAVLVSGVQESWAWWSLLEEVLTSVEHSLCPVGWNVTPGAWLPRLQK